MDEIPRVSVVIPTYNYSRFVVGAVESVLAQTFTNFEVIVVDDGSKDDTRERLAPLFDRIRYIYQENQGIAAARNRGIREARGAFIGLLDSDDRWHPRYLELMLPKLEAHPDLALLGSGRTSDAECTWEDIHNSSPDFAEIPVEWLLTRHPLCPSGVLIRRSIFDTVGLFDATVPGVEDRDMWIRIGLAARVGFLPLRLAWYRFHDGSVSAPRNTQKMEVSDRLALDRAFASPLLRDRRILRRQALSILNWTAAIAYREAGEFAHVWRCAVQALAYWPVPYSSCVRTALWNFSANPSWNAKAARDRADPLHSNRNFRLRFLASTLLKQVQQMWPVRPTGRPRCSSAGNDL